ncbi:MAG: 2,3-cyclic 3-phosphodiesterase [Solirubrobacterales bacterium]|jgi:2'-5' RNA ligase|nr:2,3-cyclic 3-phosphodiesterase [Solirubrobacterales bacterium]
MTAEQDEPKRLRLFVALDLPDRTRAGIAEWGRDALGDPALRPVAEESLHITLAFLGSRAEAEVDPIAAVVRECGLPAPKIELGQPEPRPRRGRAKVYALPVASEGTKALQAGLVSKLASAGLYEAEERPFWPHVTVARVRNEAGGKRRPRVVERPPRGLPQELMQAHRAVRLSFYLSNLQPEGARYVPLAQVELPRQGGSEVI